jgi:hypothetical protein
MRSADGTQKLSPQCRVAREAADESVRAHAFFTATILAEQQAELLGIDHTGGPTRVSVRDEDLRDVARHPLLVGEAVADDVDEARDSAKTVESTARLVSDVGNAAKRNEVMRTDAVHRDPADDDEVLSVVGEPFTEHGGRVLAIPTEQALLPECANAAGRLLHMRVALDATRGEQSVNRALEGFRVERLSLRDADLSVDGGMGFVRHGASSLADVRTSGRISRMSIVPRAGLLCETAVDAHRWW